MVPDQAERAWTVADHQVPAHRIPAAQIPAPTASHPAEIRQAAPRHASTRPPAGATARRDLRTRTIAEAVLVVALTLVTFWWATGGGLTDLGGWASGLTSLGRLTGLLASVLLLVQVLLMARVPLLERAFGQDRLAVIHRLV